LNSLTPRERVIIVGSGRTAEHIAWLMSHPAYSSKFQVIGFIDDDLRSQGMTIYGSKVIGRIDDIPGIVQKVDIGLIILADSHTASHKYKEFRKLADFRPARVVVAPDIFGSLSGLDSTAANSLVSGDLNDFQCQHCLARYAELKYMRAGLPEQ
jgi:FlaA1/EpsC-like NDP-sugar epimerase